MRVLGLLLLLAVLGAGGAAGVLLYRQLDSKTVVVAAALGAPVGGCGSMAFDVGARTLALGQLALHQGQGASGSVVVGGDENADLGLRIWSPHNRLVFDGTRPQHEQPFSVQAGVRGDYRFEFDNRHSAFTSKDVTVTVCVP
jgi:hypothetical protein